MKVRLKLDKDAILGGLIAHAEKLIFGVFILMFLLLCVGALKQKPYDKTPDKFKAESLRVDQLVESTKWDPAEAGVEPPEPIVVGMIPKEKYFVRDPINQPPWEDGQQRRGEPQYLPVRDLHVATGYGAVAVIGAPAAGVAPVKPAAAPPPEKDMGLFGGNRGGGGNARTVNPVDTAIKGKQWAVITAVVPAPQQEQTFRTAFASAPQPQQDVPNWRFFEVQRQEGEGPWAPLDLKKMQAEESTLAGFDADTADKDYIVLSRLCRRLPRLVDKSHDKSVVNPTIAQLSAERDAERATNNVAAPKASTPLKNNAFNQNVPMLGAGQQPEASANKYEFEQMFRCFDYTVQPGKTYRYRVRLLLDNPNKDLPRYLVKSAELLKGDFRATPWSEASPVVNVPRASSMLAGAVEKPRSASQEPKAQVVVRMWDSARAVDALKFAGLVRGQMANFNELTPLKDPAAGTVDKQLVNFQTNLVLLDLTGGDTLPGYRGRAPGRVLLLGPGGELDVKSELADVESYESEELRIRELGDAVTAAADAAAEKPKKKDEEERGLGFGLKPERGLGSGKLQDDAGKNPGRKRGER